MSSKQSLVTLMTSNFVLWMSYFCRSILTISLVSSSCGQSHAKCRSVLLSLSRTLIPITCEWVYWTKFNQQFYSCIRLWILHHNELQDPHVVTLEVLKRTSTILQEQLGNVQSVVLHCLLQGLIDHSDFISLTGFSFAVSSGLEPLHHFVLISTT